MKTAIVYIVIFVLTPILLTAQITTPIIKANFGVDADLRSNYFNGLVQTGNDDWFKLPGTFGSGEFVIDTAGVAQILADYTTNPNSRKLPFYRTMRFPAYSTINNRLLIDAYYVRDYHGDDSTVFASGSNKNGMSPQNWSCPVSQSIPDKNEILDMMIHVRRAGPNLTDSMWLFGGLSIENTTGNRYFDFEMYQTDIYYDRGTRQFYNYGPNAGHTRWQFDASGNMTSPGDIILTAEYSSSSLTNVEARIWIDKNDLSIIPAGFNWTGAFDGASASAQYGYAGIMPKTVGAFYTGLQSVNNTWAGPFSLVLGDNSIVTTYTARQFMEFSVNLSKLGLDDSKIFGGDDCLMPFRRIIVKTRASTSFTSELKDFIAPFDFFIAPAAQVETITPQICDTGSISQIYVLNPIPTSIYQWSTPNGNIVGTTTGPSIYVDTPGVYIVQQYLQAGCNVYATDTITIGSLGDCNVLANNLLDFKSRLNNQIVELNWKVLQNEQVRFFDIERSTDGSMFTKIKRLYTQQGLYGELTYEYTDDISQLAAHDVYYRIVMNEINGRQKTSNIIRHSLGQAGFDDISFFPNPVKEFLQIRINSEKDGTAQLALFDLTGRNIYKKVLLVQEGTNIYNLTNVANLPTGVVYAEIYYNGQKFNKKIIIAK